MRLARPIVRLASVAWLGSVVCGLVVLKAHSLTPAPVGEPPLVRPESSRMKFDEGRANLILVAHPRCPCTRASLGELARIMAKCRGDVTPHVLFAVPRSAGQNWRNSELWRLASEIPDVHVIVDHDGREAARLGIVTSGHVLLHDREGRLLFSGGITDGRGHEGDNQGHDAIVSILKGRPPGRNMAPVFGCPIYVGERQEGGSPSGT